jgi:hypothetical protein
MCALDVIRQHVANARQCAKQVMATNALRFDAFLDTQPLVLP